MRYLRHPTHGSAVAYRVLAIALGAIFAVGSPPSAASTQAKLTVVKVGSGRGTVTSSPSGINCGPQCSHDYAHGTSVTLTADAAFNYAQSTFTGWSNCSSPSGPTCREVTDQAHLVQAHFMAHHHLTVVTRSGTGRGTVMSSFFNCDSSCDHRYDAGTQVTLFADPDQNSTFFRWSGCGSTSGATCRVTMNQERSVNANFAKVYYSLSASKTGTGRGTVTSSPSGINCGMTCSFRYDAGTQLTLTATPGPVSGFAGWSGPGCSGTGTCRVTMDQARSVTATFTRNPGPPSSQKPETPDLNGIWVTDDGAEVEIMHYHSTGHVNAFFWDKSEIKLNGGCPYGQPDRGKYVDGTVVGNVLTGKVAVCTGSRELVKKCKLGPSTVDFTTTVTKDRIEGTRVSEWWKQTTTSDPCKFTHEPARDTPVGFHLTRREPNHCPDTEEIKQYSAVTERAAQFTDLAAKFVKNKDSQMSGALDGSQKALRGISNALNRYIKTGEMCGEIHDVLGDLQEFQNAIDQINNAGCDSSVLARGFDDLFRSAGNLGKRFVKLPELTPMFEILSQNQNFFVKVSGALNPEQRWANQFSGIEGYVPSCR